MDLVEIEWGGVEWIDLAKDRDKWRALVFHKMLGNYQVATQLTASRVVLSSIVSYLLLKSEFTAIINY
jgi:hypothetical protein